MNKIFFLFSVMTLLSSCAFGENNASSNSASGQIYGATEISGTGIEVATW